MNYTQEELQKAYEDWTNSNQNTEDRKNKWHHYCDVRDNLPAGSSAHRIIKEIHDSD
jgi:hypothetical protein